MTRWAVEPLDLLRELRELKPTIVHFSGRGTRPVATTDLAHRDVVADTVHADGKTSSVVFDSANAVRGLVLGGSISTRNGA